MYVPTFSDPFNLGIALLVAVGTWLCWRPLERWKYRNIPGPFGWPLLGNLLPIQQLGTHEYCKMLAAKYGPVFKIWLGGHVWVMVSDADLARKLGFKLLSRPRLGKYFTIMRGYEDHLDSRNLLYLKGEEWRMARKLFDTQMLNPERLPAHVSVLDSLLGECVARLHKLSTTAKPVDINEEMKLVAMSAIAKASFGVDLQLLNGQQPSAATARLRNAAYDMIDSLSMDRSSVWHRLSLLVPDLRPMLRSLAYLLPDQFHTNIVQSFLTMGDVVMKYVQPIKGSNEADQHDSAHAESFLHLLVRAQEREGKLDDATLIGSMMIFFMAGYETTSSTLAFAMYLLTTHPEAAEKLRQEADSMPKDKPLTYADMDKLAYADAVLKETMRLYPVAAFLFRENPEDMDIGGYLVPKQSTIGIAQYGPHLDEQYYPRCREFIPERWLPGHEHLAPSNPHAFLPFGWGPRMCVGFKFATLEMKLALTRLHQHFTFSLSPMCPHPLKAKLGFTLFPPDGVHLLLHPRVEQ